MQVIGWLKPLLFALSLVPFARLILLGFQDGLGANPIEFITRSTGFWTLTFLCLALSVSPLRRLTGWQWLIRIRRMVGLFTFFYALLHFTTYIWFDQWFSATDIIADIWKRPFITVGFAAFVLLLPLTFTSTNRMMRRLGRRWAQLHQLAYLIAGLGVVHFWWMKQGKNDLAEPWIFTLIVAGLLLFRLVGWFGRASASRRQQTALRGQQLGD